MLSAMVERFSDMKMAYADFDPRCSFFFFVFLFSSVCREPLRARFASARALPLSDFVFYITENKIAQWKCSRRRDPDILHLMAGDLDTPVTAVDGGAGWGGWVGCY